MEKIFFHKEMEKLHSKMTFRAKMHFSIKTEFFIQKCTFSHEEKLQPKIISILTCNFSFLNQINSLFRSIRFFRAKKCENANFRVKIFIFVSIFVWRKGDIRSKFSVIKYELWEIFNISNYFMLQSNSQTILRQRRNIITLIGGKHFWKRTLFSMKIIFYVNFVILHVNSVILCVNFVISV